MNATTHEAVGTVIEYVDPVGKSHDALVTAVWGPDLGVNSINLVFVSDNHAKTDSCGRQIVRETSVSPEGPNTAYGRFYRIK
jgi:hypothetical protein